VTAVLTHHVRAALKELSDFEYQSRVWTGRGAANEMASFVECVVQLFDDSGLGPALDSGHPVFAPAIDAELRALDDLLRRVDDTQRPDELVQDPAMRPVRDRAAAILRAIRDVAGTTVE
jgi:hypothetical protein